MNPVQVLEIQFYPLRFPDIRTTVFSFAKLSRNVSTPSCKCPIFASFLFLRHFTQRRRNELKVGGTEHTSAEGASSVEGSGGILPREILKTRTQEMPFPAIWALNLEFILIAKMS